MEIDIAGTVHFDLLMDQLGIGQKEMHLKQKEFLSARNKLSVLIDEFNKKRLDAFEGQLRLRNLLWCTHCSSLFPTDDLELLLIVDRGTVSVGEEGDRVFTTSRRFHRACKNCKALLLKNNGSFGTYDERAEDQSSYKVYSVELREGAYYQGDIKLEGMLPPMPPAHFDRWSKEWGIPPQLELDKDGKLVFKNSTKVFPVY
jgi:hypothetical protein